MNTNVSSLTIVHRRMLSYRACAIYLARHGDQPHTQPSSSNHTQQPHTKHLSQLLITLAWIIISINNNRVLQVELCWNGAHIIPYFKFQLSPSAERAALPSLPPPLPICNPLSLSLSLSFSCSVRNPSTANCSAAFLHMETSMKWVRGTLLISYVSYLTFDFFKIYKHFFFMAFNWYCLSGGSRKGLKCTAWWKCAAKDCEVLRHNVTNGPLGAIRWQIFARSNLLGMPVLLLRWFDIRK